MSYIVEKDGKYLMKCRKWTTKIKDAEKFEGIMIAKIVARVFNGSIKEV